MLCCSTTCTFLLAALLIAVGSMPCVTAQVYCRSPSLPNHIGGMWTQAAPAAVTSESKSLCEGTVSVSETEICVEGRVNYRQLREAVGRSTRRPAADTISVTGHLLSGSGNLVLGTDANFLYDYVTKYTVDGVQYENTNETMVDNLFAASRGTIDGVCFDKATFAPEEKSYYSVSHGFALLLFGVNIDDVQAANAFYVNSISVITEFYSPRDPPFLGLAVGGILNSIISFLGGLTPGFLFNFLPLLGALGTFRLFVFGTTDTEAFPHPLPAPSIPIEDVQVDVAWDTLMAAMRDGLFTQGNGILPALFGIIGKRITKGGYCWSETDAASLDIQAPAGQGAELDAYIQDIVLPKLKAFGDGKVSIHMGKRISEGSSLVDSALSFYESQCGVELNVSPENCYHPMCTRSNKVSDFTYPSQYFT